MLGLWRYAFSMNTTQHLVHPTFLPRVFHKGLRGRSGFRATVSVHFIITLRFLNKMRYSAVWMKGVTFLSRSPFTYWDLVGNKALESLYNPCIIYFIFPVNHKRHIKISVFICLYSVFPYSLPLSLCLGVLARSTFALISFLSSGQCGFGAYMSRIKVLGFRVRYCPRMNSWIILIIKSRRAANVTPIKLFMV